MADSPVISILAVYKLLQKKGEELLQRYEQGDPAVTFQDLMDCSRDLHRAQEELSDVMEVEINQFNGKCKNAKQSRKSAVREADRKKNISELGY